MLQQCLWHVEVKLIMSQEPKVYVEATALPGECGSPSPMNIPIAARPHGDSLYGKHYTVLKFPAFLLLYHCPWFLGTLLLVIF